MRAESVQNAIEDVPKETADPQPRPHGTTAVDFRVLLEGSLDMIWLAQVNPSSHRFVYASPSSSDVLGFSPDEILRLTPEDIYTSESLDIIAGDVRKISSGEGTSTVLVEAIRKDGRSVWLENKVRVMERGEDGEMTVAIYLRDVTERKLLQDKLARLAFVDGLTGIDNRRAFDRAIVTEWKRAVRTGWPLSLILLDVDHFKRFNDQYGHQLGDDCLRSISQAVRSEVHRPGDVVARYGGEEIAVLLPQTDCDGAGTLANHLCRSVAELHIPHSQNENRGVVTISGGVSTAEARTAAGFEMPARLLFAADNGLYVAKRQGRNKVVAFPLASAGPPA